MGTDYVGLHTHTNFASDKPSAFQFHHSSGLGVWPIRVQFHRDTCVRGVGWHWTQIEYKMHAEPSCHSTADMFFNENQIRSQWYEIYCVKLFASEPMPSFWFCLVFIDPKRDGKTILMDQCPMVNGDSFQFWSDSIDIRLDYDSLDEVRNQKLDFVSINYLFI